MTVAKVQGSEWINIVNRNFDKLDGRVETLEGAAARGKYTADADDATAGTLSIDTGLAAPTGFIVQILRSGAVITGDAAISLSSADLVVADGSTYSVTAGDVVNWIAV